MDTPDNTLTIPVPLDLFTRNHVTEGLRSHGVPVEATPDGVNVERGKGALSVVYDANAKSYAVTWNPAGEIDSGLRVPDFAVAHGQMW